MPKQKQIDDERFSQVNWHPKFRRIPRQVRKIKIDKRFESMFKDPNFKLKHAVDKRGRPLGHTSTEDLRRYYDLSSSESEDEDEEKSPENEKSKKDRETEESGNESSEESSEEKEKDEDEEIKIDLARGEGNISSSSEDSSSEWEFQEDEDAPAHDWADVDTAQAPTIENATSRLAICNMDWERITAKDLLVLLNSFKPSSGDVRSVKIYPSDFGLQRMAEEQKNGPVELREFKTESGDEDQESDEDAEKTFLDKAQEERRQKILLEKLRRYEFNRLKYYYAVAECDSVATAEHIYSNCDGMEYEASGTRLDLRFIPDDMEFDQQPKDAATSFGDLSNYRPALFVNKALQQSRPTLTWEEERDPKRAELTKKAFENPQEWDRLELNGVLASPSSSEASDGEDAGSEEKVGRSVKDEFKSVLLDSLKKGGNEVHKREDHQEASDDDIEMEIKWDAGVEEQLQKANGSNRKDDKKSQWEKYLERRKEKRRQRKEELRRRRQEVKRQRRGYSDEDSLPSDIEDEPRTVDKTTRRRKQPQPQPEDEEDAEEKQKQTEELELLLADSDEETKSRHFNLKKLLKTDKKKAKTVKTASAQGKTEEDEEDFEMNVEDPRFNAIFSSHLYNIDPSDPAFKKTPGMKKLVEEKFKTKGASGRAKKADKIEATPAPVAEPQKIPVEQPKNPELSLLAKRVKAKTDMLRKEKEQRRVKKS